MKTKAPDKNAVENFFSFLIASCQQKLFTPGPLGVSMTTKEAMLKDVGSRDKEFIKLIKNIRESLVKIAGK